MNFLISSFDSIPKTSTISLIPYKIAYKIKLFSQ